MDIKTHQLINPKLCGRPLTLAPGYSSVELKTTLEMAVDDRGLVHGGFIFGLADHSAMIAINDPNVVLGAAEVKFLKPVAVDQTVVAEAQVEALAEQQAGRKKRVFVHVMHQQEKVFEGTFTCFVLPKHVFDSPR